MAISYGNVYVARVAMGANDAQTLQALREAEAYHGPSLIIAYSHCIAHGYDLRHGIDQQNAAVQSGYWPLFRYNPRAPRQGESPFVLDSRAPTLPSAEHSPGRAQIRSHRSRRVGRRPRAAAAGRSGHVSARWQLYAQFAAMKPGGHHGLTEISDR